MGTATGGLLRFDLRAADAPPELLGEAGAPVTALALLIGGRTLVVGRADGDLSSWFAVPQESGPRRFTKIREYPPYPSAIEHLAPSQRDRTFLAASGDATLGLQHSTSGRQLWRGPSPIGAVSALAFSPKGDGGALAAPDELAVLGDFERASGAVARVALRARLVRGRAASRVRLAVVER